MKERDLAFDVYPSPRTGERPPQKIEGQESKARNFAAEILKRVSRSFYRPQDK